MLPTLQFSEPPEPFLAADERVCDLVERPGVLAFMAFVLEHQGGWDLGRLRGCDVGGTSGHHSGRAWDWKIDATDPTQRARADELLAWLLANDGELFRRAGLSYIIWDRKVSRGTGWKDYDGFVDGKCSPGKTCRNPHTDHVHFSFNVPGADGETSFYRWLEDKPSVKPGGSIWPFLLGTAAGLGAVQLWKSTGRKSQMNWRR